ncbi:ZIP family metal transporter [Psychroflexus sp. CAK8W]|uniref:ZIP family metal transporter n=1 Tax=Psychroflexus longus TaxID=2873596 RepID=A0ABS7XM44_9FLAO|nr:ZIP family metal transporter [Psychroflexus longus]MBZ9778956.1 ZIP family metal transporter [Psychroflexus longus]
MFDEPVLKVLLYALITAITTGFGAIPFFFVKKMPKKWLGWGGAVASGIMLAASFRLVNEGIGYNLYRTIIGVLVGLVFILLSQKWLSKHDDLHVGKLKGANAKKALMIIGVMTIHSFAEGVGIGVSFGGDEGFGVFMSAAIAIHNIPEGLAISLVLIPKGMSTWKAGVWSIVSSLPQPLLAIPAFLFVSAFKPFLPVGLGLAAGAMVWMVFSDLIPDALENSKKQHVATIVTVSIAMMMLFQVLME